jgi:hypothetical protein
MKCFLAVLFAAPEKFFERGAWDKMDEGARGAKAWGRAVVLSIGKVDHPSHVVFYRGGFVTPRALHEATRAGVAGGGLEGSVSILNVLSIAAEMSVPANFSELAARLSK